MAISLLVAVSPPGLLIPGGKGFMEVGIPDVSHSSTSSSSSAVFQVGMLFKFFNQWRSITSNRFVLNMVWGHHFSLGHILPCLVTSDSSVSSGCGSLSHHSGGGG